jgi:hypothetical protein
LQAALKIAEDFVAAEHIDVSGGWLHEARFTLYGDKTKPEGKKTLAGFFIGCQRAASLVRRSKLWCLWTARP